MRVEGSPIPLALPHEPAAPGQLRGMPGAAEQAVAAGETDALSALGDHFLSLVVNANERAQSAHRQMDAVANGTSDDIHGTMIEVTKAGIETRLLVTAKNKVLDAFYELWRMNV